MRNATEVRIAQRAMTWLFEWIDQRRLEQDEETRTGHGEDGPASTDEEHLLKDEMDNLITEIDRHDAPKTSLYADQWRPPRFGARCSHFAVVDMRAKKTATTSIMVIRVLFRVTQNGLPSESCRS